MNLLQKEKGKEMAEVSGCTLLCLIVFLLLASGIRSAIPFSDEMRRRPAYRFVNAAIVTGGVIGCVFLGGFLQNRYDFGQEVSRLIEGETEYLYGIGYEEGDEADRVCLVANEKDTEAVIRIIADIMEEHGYAQVPIKDVVVEGLALDPYFTIKKNGIDIGTVEIDYKAKYKRLLFRWNRTNLQQFVNSQ